VANFREKPHDGGWISGGFFILSPKVLDYIESDEMMWEADPMLKLVAEGNVNAYKHKSFWYAMDTLRDKHYLDDLWVRGKAPWKLW